MQDTEKFLDPRQIPGVLGTDPQLSDIPSSDRLSSNGRAILVHLADALLAGQPVTVTIGDASDAAHATWAVTPERGQS
jgi:hypothetical protein